MCFSERMIQGGDQGPLSARASSPIKDGELIVHFVKITENFIFDVLKF